MKKILITGADGFVGSHFVETLLKKNYDIYATVQYNSLNNWGWLEKIKNNKVKIFCGDLRDKNFCQRVTKVDCIVNFAALIAIPYSYENFEQYIDTNIKGTFNLCDAALKNRVKKFIQISTSEIYGTADYVPIDEQHPKKPQSPYSASKIASDAIAKSYYYSYNLPVVIARPFNIYGPRQSGRAIIPTIITQVLKNNSHVKLGKITPTRDFTYVSDTCDIIERIIKSKKSIGQEINIGSGKEISIKDLYKKILQIMKVRFKIKSNNTNRLRPKKSEVERLICNNKKMINILNIKPKISLEEGLKLTLKWFKDEENLKQYKNIYTK